MLKLPNLDDQRFEDIVETARRRAMQYFPQWTNFNPSDPGLTMLELFAWLKEMQQYHLDRITESGILACLGLLRMTPKKASPSEVTGVFAFSEQEKQKAKLLPAGFQVTAESGIVFETPTPVVIGNAEIHAVWVDNGTGPVELDYDLYTRGLQIEPFGSEETENSCLYIGIKGQVATELDMLDLYFDIYDEYAVPRNSYGDNLTPSREIIWEYGEDFSGADFVVDMTRGFSVSGEVCIGVSPDWEQSVPVEGMPKCYWVRAVLKERGCEEVPKINKIYKDYSALLQRETLSISVDIKPSSGKLTLKSFLGIKGENIVFSANEDGWKRYDHGKSVRLHDKTEVEVAGDCVYRIVSVKPGFNALMSTYVDLPGTTLTLQTDGFVDSPEIMIEEEGIWREWSFTADLHTAGPHDRVFTIDPAAGCIVFGDNECGACPPAGIDNVIIMTCSVTQGAEGNIMPHALISATSSMEGLLIDNTEPAFGGRNAQSIDNALADVSAMLSKPERCVTSRDYETIAAETPGARIMKVRAVEGYDPSSGTLNLPARMTVVVAPFGNTALPMPDTRFLTRVRRHMEKSRLLSVCLEVAAPTYTPVSVKVEATATDRETAEKQIRQILTDYFSPICGSLEIGNAVKLTDILVAVNGCTAVSRIISVTLSAPGNAAGLDRHGNIILKPHALAYPGDFEISFK